MVIQIVLWTVVVAFAVITLLTIINVFNIQPIVESCRAPAKFSNKLFVVLIIEIVGLCLSMAGVVIYEPLKHIEAKQEAEEGLHLSLEAWKKSSMSWMDEPSGLSRSGLKDPNQTGTLLVGVDDEESAVFILQASPDHFPLVRARLTLDPTIEDLEAITYDGTRYYYALASHRLTGNEDNAPRTRKLLQVVIPDSWRDGYGSVSVESSIDLTDPPRDATGLATGLEEFLRRHQVSVNENLWQRREPGDQPFALEFEGIAIHGDNLYLGLKYPLDSGNAILLTYSWSAQNFGQYCTLDLEGQGISDMAVDGSDIILASNPPQNVDKDADRASLQYYGASRLWRFSLEDPAFSGSNCEGLVGEELTCLKPRPDAKLEGVAVAASELFLAFDGEQPYFDRLPLADCGKARD